MNQITDYIHSRGATVAAAITLTLLTVIAIRMDAVADIEGNRGLAFLSANLWIDNPVISTCVSILAIYAIAAGLLALNRSFNILRHMTSMWATMFLVLQCSIPGIDANFSAASMLTLVFYTATALLYGCYDRPTRKRPIFMIFALLSAGSLFQYAYMFYIPVFIVGMIQMKVMDFKGFLAALLGVITPPWILIGTGILTPQQIDWPEFVSAMSALHDSDVIMLLVSVILSACIGVGLFMASMMKLLSYNAKNRAYNGFLTIAMLATIVLMVVDYLNIAVYTMLLNSLAAYQMAHFFSSHRQSRSYIPVLTIMACYFAIYIFTIF